MTERKPAHGEIDWNTAQVSDGELVVEVTGEPSASWAKHVGEVVERLERHAGGSWGSVAISKSQVKVSGVQPGTEADVRHFIEGVVLQANADYAPDPEDTDGGDGGSESDREMSTAFREFGDDPDAGEGEDVSRSPQP